MLPEESNTFAQGVSDALLSNDAAGSFDFAFIDADKANYDGYYERILALLRAGGMLAVDNVLWSGKVTGDYEKLDRDTRLLMDFNKLIQDDSRVENVLLPIRDGIMIARKL